MFKQELFGKKFRKISIFYKPENLVILPAFDINFFFYVLRLRAVTISWHVPKSKWLFYIYDFGIYQLIIPVLNLKT
jgi:hypothetical protein